MNDYSWGANVAPQRNVNKEYQDFLRSRVTREFEARFLSFVTRIAAQRLIMDQQQTQWRAPTPTKCRHRVY